MRRSLVRGGHGRAGRDGKRFMKIIIDHEYPAATGRSLFMTHHARHSIDKIIYIENIHGTRDQYEKKQEKTSPKLESPNF